MARATQTKQLEDETVLEEACARNRPVELHYYNTSGEFFAAKTRLLGIYEDQLLLDTPQSIGKQVHFSAGQPIEAYILTGEHTHTFRAKITKTQCHVKLNQYVTVDGLFITKPALIKEGQRRHDLRMSTAGLEDTIPVTLHDTWSKQAGAAPVNAAVFQGRVTNLSGGGCGLLLETIQCSKLNIGKQMFVGFTLPEQDTELIFQVEIRTVGLTGPKGSMTRLGVQYLNWPNQAYLRRTLRSIEQFVAELQRRANNRRARR